MVRYYYDAWGNHKVCDANGTEITDTTHIGHLNPIRYRGYYYDKEFGLYYLKSRYYDPSVGRFITPDDVDYVDADVVNGLNLYAYCNNNPIMYEDPKGHAFFSILLGAILLGTIMGAVVGGIANAAVGQDVGCGIVSGAVIGSLFGLGVGLSVGLATVAGVAATIGSVAAATFTAFVGAAQIIAIVDSHIQVNKYSDAVWEGSTDKIPSSKFNTAEKRVAYINAIYENYKDNWTKAQLYRELKYHYATQKFFDACGIDSYKSSLDRPDIEDIQGFRKPIVSSYVLRFLGNIFSLLYK